MCLFVFVCFYLTFLMSLRLRPHTNATVATLRLPPTRRVATLYCLRLWQCSVPLLRAGPGRARPLFSRICRSINFDIYFLYCKNFSADGITEIKNEMTLNQPPSYELCPVPGCNRDRNGGCAGENLTRSPALMRD